MRRNVTLTAALLILMGALPVGVLAAPQPAPTHVTLHVSSKYKSNMSFKHVMASATLRYTKSDVIVKVTADNLPSPSTLGESVYLVFASDGHMTSKVGVLKLTGHMAGVTGQVMMTKVHDLYIYAEPSATEKHPMGKLVLSAMV